MNKALNNGRMPLHIVADFGQTELIQLLLSSGAEINVGDAAESRHRTLPPLGMNEVLRVNHCFSLPTG